MSVALLVKYTALNYNAMIAHHLVFKENARLRFALRELKRTFGGLT